MTILFWARFPGMPQAGDPGEPRPVYYVGSERVSDSSGDHDRVFCYALADSGYLMRLPLTEAMPLVAADAPPAVGPEPEPAAAPSTRRGQAGTAALHAYRAARKRTLPEPEFELVPPGEAGTEADGAQRAAGVSEYS